MIRQLARSDKGLYLTLLVNFSLMGGVVTLFGAALSKVIEAYGWSYTDAGAIYAAASIGFFSSSLVTGFLIDHFGSKRVMVIGLIAESLALMVFARNPSVPLNVALYFIVGLGLGSNEAITNAAVVRIEERGKSRLMSLMHAFWCIGAVVGPLGVANLIRTTVDWKIVFPTFGALILVMTLLLSFRRFPKPLGSGGGRTGADREEPGRAGAEGTGGGDSVAGGGSAAAGQRGASAWARLRSGTGSLVLLCALSIFVYIGVEKGVYSWISIFFVRVLHSSLSLGATMVALYWTGQFVGRLGISVVYTGTRLERVLLLLSGLTVVSLVALVFVRVTWIAIACTFIAGLANSGIFPLVISLTGKYSARGRSVGLVTSAGGVAGFLFPMMVAAVSDAYGISTGFETVFLISLVLLAVCLIVAARVRQLDRRESIASTSEVRIA